MGNKGERIITTSVTTARQVYKHLSGSLFLSSIESVYSDGEKPIPAGDQCSQDPDREDMADGTLHAAFPDFQFYI
jgi:hypothetical protein